MPRKQKVPVRRGRPPKNPVTIAPTPLAATLCRILVERHLSARGLALDAGLSEDTVRSIISGRSREPRAQVVRALAEHLGLTQEDLLDGSAPAAAREAIIYIILREISWSPDRDVSPRAATGISVHHGLQWTVPKDSLGDHADGGGLAVFRCAEDVAGMARGDRLIVDTGDTGPSPPGILVVWDGYAAVVARCHLVRGAEGHMLRMDGSAGESELRLGTDVTILGRVVGRFGIL